MNPNIITYDFVDSTMNEAQRLLEREFQQHQDVIILARQQTSGRGRLGRQWISSRGNLYMSMIVQDVPTDKLSEYAVLWGLILHEVIGELVTGAQKVQCKWPNDILIDDKKVAGILIERFQSGDKNSLIIGIGMNLDHHPQDVRFPATSLKEIGAKAALPENLVAMIHKKHRVLRLLWENEGFSPIRQKWLDAAWGLQKEINIRQDDQSMVGIFETIDQKGAIEIKEKDGSVRKVYTGDLFKETINVTRH